MSIVAALLGKLALKPMVKNMSKDHHKIQNKLGKDNLYGIGTPKMKKGGRIKKVMGESCSSHTQSGSLVLEIQRRNRARNRGKK